MSAAAKCERYAVTVTALDPVRIGGPKDPLSGADNPVATVGSRACIPGPSLKGALRAEIERHLIALAGNDACRPCIPSTKLSNDEQALVKDGKYRRESCHYPCNHSDERGRGSRDGAQLHTICPTCYLLGAQGLMGFVRVPFLFAQAAPDELYSARIERMSQTVMQGTNRPYQLLPPDTKFVG